VKIVSLLASGTEIVCELGLEASLVGISHECDHPPEILDRPRLSRPRFDPAGLSSAEIDRAVRDAASAGASPYVLDVEKLAELAPHLVLTQAMCEVCAVPVQGARQACETAGIDAAILSLDAHSLREVLDCVGLVGGATGRADRAAALVAALRQRLHDVTRAVAGTRRPRVLALEWLDPIFVPGHWVPEMIDLAGGECLAGEAKARSVQVDAEELAGLDPDVLLIMPCGYGLAASRRDADAHARRLARLATRAIEEGRACVVDASSYFNRSGPRVVEGVEILAGLIHPEIFPLPAAGRADTWRPAPEKA